MRGTRWLFSAVAAAVLAAVGAVDECTGECELCANSACDHNGLMCMDPNTTHDGDWRCVCVAPRCDTAGSGISARAREDLAVHAAMAKLFSAATPLSASAGFVGRFGALRTLYCNAGDYAVEVINGNEVVLDSGGGGSTVVETARSHPWRLPFEWYPFQVALLGGSDPDSYVSGVLVFHAAALLLGWGLAWGVMTKADVPFPSPPALVSAIQYYLFQGSTYAAVDLALAPLVRTGSALPVLWGVCALLGLAASVYWLDRRVLFRAATKAAAVERLALAPVSSVNGDRSVDSNIPLRAASRDADPAQDGKVTWRHEVRRFAFGDVVWVEKMDETLDGDTIGTSPRAQFCARYGSIFASLRPGMAPMVLLDLASIATVSVAAVWHPASADACNLRSLVLVAVSIGHFVVLCRYRPFIAPADNAVAILLSAMTCVGSICVALGIALRLVKDSLILGTAALTMWAGYYVVMLKVVWDVAVWSFDAREKRKKRQLPSFDRQLSTQIMCPDAETTTTSTTTTATTTTMQSFPNLASTHETTCSRAQEQAPRRSYCPPDGLKRDEKSPSPCSRAERGDRWLSKSVLGLPPRTPNTQLSPALHLAKSPATPNIPEPHSPLMPPALRTKTSPRAIDAVNVTTLLNDPKLTLPALPRPFYGTPQLSPQERDGPELTPRTELLPKPSHRLLLRNGSGVLRHCQRAESVDFQQQGTRVPMAAGRRRLSVGNEPSPKVVAWLTPRQAVAASATATLLPPRAQDLQSFESAADTSGAATQKSQLPQDTSTNWLTSVKSVETQPASEDHTALPQAPSVLILPPRLIPDQGQPQPPVGSFRSAGVASGHAQSIVDGCVARSLAPSPMATTSHSGAKLSPV